MTGAVLGFIAGLIVGSCTTLAAFSKDRKRIETSKRDLMSEWVEYWKRKAELDKLERDLAVRGGAYEGRAS